MAKVSVDDLRTMYQSSVCLYKNKPYYIHQISPRYMATCTDLFTQRQVEIEMDETTFDPPRRIGFMNLMGSVIYAARRPVRRYKAGLSKENTAFEYIHGIEYPEGGGRTLAEASSLKHISMADAMFDNYPTFQEARDKIKNGNTSAIAIDHQFAITKDRLVFYKKECVGDFPASAKTIYDIVFAKKHKYLITLLDGNHEKSI